MSTNTLDKPTVRPYMPLEDVLRYARRYRVFLCYRSDGAIDVWSCGRKLPMVFKRGVHKSQAQLLRMLREHDWRVCPARDLHALEWVYFRSLDRHLCLMCARIAV